MNMGKCGQTYAVKNLHTDCKCLLPKAIKCTVRAAIVPNTRPRCLPDGGYKEVFEWQK